MYHILNSPLTARDRIAEAVLPAVIQACSGDRPIAEASFPEHFAQQAYAIADAMLRMRRSVSVAGLGVSRAVVLSADDYKPASPPNTMTPAAATTCGGQFTDHEKAALEEQAGRPIDWSQVKVSKAPPTFTHAKTEGVAGYAPKFKPGDRVYFNSEARVFGVVVSADEWPHAPLPPSNKPVFARWVGSTTVGWMPEFLVFPDLRTVAGGGVLKLRHACSGRTRGGQSITLTTHDSSSIFPFGCLLHGAMYWWTEDGSWCLPGVHDHPLDIVELIEEGA